MNELEIFNKHKNSTVVQTILGMAEGKIKCSPTTQDRAFDYLTQLGRAAMQEAGIKPNPYGEWAWADCVFFDFQMSDKDKIRLLEQCEGQAERIEVLREQGEVQR